MRKSLQDLEAQIEKSSGLRNNFKTRSPRTIAQVSQCILTQYPFKPLYKSLGIPLQTLLTTPTQTREHKCPPRRWSVPECIELVVGPHSMPNPPAQPPQILQDTRHQKPNPTTLSRPEARTHNTPNRRSPNKHHHRTRKALSPNSPRCTSPQTLTTHHVKRTLKRRPYRIRQEKP